MKNESQTDVPYWFWLLAATANGTGRKAREAQQALRILTEVKHG